MTPDERQALAELGETLSHWKEGTRPGDDRITASHVALAIYNLIDAVITAAKPKPLAAGEVLAVTAKAITDSKGRVIARRKGPPGGRTPRQNR